MVLQNGSTSTRPAKEGVSQLTKGVAHDYNPYIILPCYLTYAHKTIRIRVPPPICSTHCHRHPSWDKPWVTSEEYLGSLSCILIWRHNRAIYRNSRITTVNCGEEREGTRKGALLRSDYTFQTHIVICWVGWIFMK